MRRMQSNQRGFTLIELMLAVAVGSIVGTTFFGIMYWQNVGYLERLDEVDAHQNSMASLNVLRRYVRVAGWGMGQSATNLQAGSQAFVGKCYSTGSPTTAEQYNCDGVDSGSDRLRSVFINNDTEFVGNQPSGSLQTCATPYTTGSTSIHVNQNPVLPFTYPQLAAIGGTCSSTSNTSGDLVLVSGDSGSGDSCLHRYAYTTFFGGSTTLSCGSGAGYNANFAFGRATVADFFIGVDITNTPVLFLRTDPRTSLSRAYVVAYDVEDMQVKYGIDSTTAPDRAVDVWCTDPRGSDQGGSSCLGATYATPVVLSRIVAVQVVLRVRTDATRQGLVPQPLNPNLIASRPVANQKDGYNRWLYSTTIALRNNNI